MSAQSTLSTQPLSLYFDTISQLLAWTPQNQAFDAFNIAQVPLRSRPAPPTPRPLVHDCNDFNGGYVNPGDLYPQGASSIDTYNFTFWQYLDNFCYFSHHRISIPTTWWANAAHLHGVPIIGTIIFENDPDDFSLMIQKSAQCIEQLVMLSQHYGFDGWFFNVEIGLPGGASQVPQLISFIQNLRIAMHKVNPSALILWYDSVTVDGWVSYQNCLNGQNNAFFVASDGIFTNYWWWQDAKSNIGTSVNTAQSDQRSPFDVYTGVDVYARGTGYQPANTNPGDDAIAAVGACVQYGTSTGPFAPGWTYGNAQGASPEPHHTNFEILDTQFWIGTGAGYNPGTSRNSNCIAKYIPERIVPGALPFGTNFDRGCGTNFVVRGTTVSSAEWSNLSLQGPQPTYRYWALPGSASSFNVSFAYGNGYDGGACLIIQGTNSGVNDVASYRLYDLNAQVQGSTTIQVVFNPLTISNYPSVQVRLIFSDGSSYTTSSTPAPLNGWLAVSETMGSNIGKTIAQIVLLVGPSSNQQTPGVNYGVVIGAISLAPADTSAPVSVQNLTAQAVYADSANMGALLTWSYSADSARFFDIWRIDGATPQWLNRVCANAVWIENLAAIGTSLACSFAVQPVDYGLNPQPLSSAATVALNVNPMAFNDGPTIALLGNPAITSITVMSGDILNAIQIMNGNYTLPQHGDTSGATSSVALAAGDLIVSVSGSTGTWYGWNCVVLLTLKTQQGTVYGPFGSLNGVTSSTPFSYNAPAGQSVVAFSGSLVNVPLANQSRTNIIQTLQPIFG